MDGKKNAYTILELEPNPDIDEATIKKAYRRLAIIKHPDKNRDNPNAAEEFNELEQAYRLLLDKAARGALDDLLRAQAQRAARESAVSDKRRKLKEDLERREKQAASEKSEEELAKQRLKSEVDEEEMRKEKEEEEERRRQRAAEQQRKRRAERSEAEVVEQRKRQAAAARRRRAKQSEEAAKERRKRDAEAKRRQRANLSEEQKMEWRRRHAEGARRRRAAMKEAKEGSRSSTEPEEYNTVFSAGDCDAWVTLNEAADLLLQASAVC